MAQSAENFYNFALFLKTAENYDFSHILAKLTAYFFPVFEKSLFLPSSQIVRGFLELP